jgi:hypothetical protein
MHKGKISGKNLSAAWAALLLGNSKAKLTDDQLVAEMGKDFPDLKGKTTITRVSMVRGCYNKGTGMFKAVGPAAKVSARYGADGVELAARSRGAAPAAKKEKASKVAKPKEGGAKKKKKAPKPEPKAPAASKGGKKKVAKVEVAVKGKKKAKAPVADATLGGDGAGPVD